MSDAALLFEQVGPVGWIILNRPKAMNAINLAMIAAFEELLPEIAGNNDIRVLAITGQGPAFCAGADLKEVLASSQLPPGEPDFIDRLTERVINPLRDF